MQLLLTLKRLRGGGVRGPPTPTLGDPLTAEGIPLPCGFSKSISSKKREKPWFFVTFNIILRHIFPENFIEFPQVVQKI